MIYGYIYKTTNLVNNKIYIGQKLGLFAPRYLGSGDYLKRAVAKYGRHKFMVEVITYADNLCSLNELEKKCIAEYRDKLGKDLLYNIAEGGLGCPRPMSKETREKVIRNHYNISGQNNPMFGKHHSEETLQRMRKPKTEEHRRHLKGLNLGRKHSEETKRKMSAAMAGKNNPMYGKNRILSLEHKRNIGLAGLGRKHSETTKQKMSLRRKKWWERKHENNLI